MWWGLVNNRISPTVAALAWFCGCSSEAIESADDPAADSGSAVTTTAEPTTSSVTSSSGQPGPDGSGDSYGGTTDGPGTADDSTSGDPVGPPVVDTFPGGRSNACDNLSLEFSPQWDHAGPSPTDAFWMMWFARRAVLFGEPAVPAELSPLGFDDYQEIEAAAAGVQAYVVSDGERVLVVFAGSQEITDWLTNFSFAQIDGSPHDLAGRVHTGFATALSAAWEPLLDAVLARADADTPVWVTGHSLGGALATVAALRLSHEGLNLAPVYAFGQPRVGNLEFAMAAQAELSGRFYRFANERDVVPRIPPWGGAAAEAGAVLPLGSGLVESLIADLDYTHTGTLFHFVPDTDPAGPVVQYPPLSDEQDLAYWSQLDARGWFALLAATEQGTWHLHDQYLCKLRAWAWPAG